MEQEKKYLYPDGETPLMKYLVDKMVVFPEDEDEATYLYLEAYNGVSCRVLEENTELWLAYQEEIKRAVAAGEIEDPDEVSKRKLAELDARCSRPIE